MNPAALLLSFLVIGVFAAAGAIALRYQSDLRRARDAAAKGSLTADTEAGRIEYDEQGAGPALLSIHGAGGGFDQGLANASALVGEGFRLIAPSRFGYLRTPIPEDDSAAAQADAHAALLSKLEIPKAIVLGVSAGSISAVELAIRRPDCVAALILVVPATYAPDSPVAVDSEAAHLRSGLSTQGWISLGGPRKSLRPRC